MAFKVFVSATSTEVGKTWLGVQVMTHLKRQGVKVCARKPAESFDPDQSEPRDSQRLALASGEAPEEVCPPHRSYPVALAPPMAAEVLGKEPIKLAELVAEHEVAKEAEICFVEGAGGIRSPLAEDGDCLDFSRAIGADLLVLVAPCQLGSISAVRCALEAAADLESLVFLNWFDAASELHRLNFNWLKDKYGLNVYRDPYSLAQDLAKRLK